MKPKVKNVYLYHHDLPDNFPVKEAVAIDTEAMGLKWRDRLCLIQFSLGDHIGHLVQIAPRPREAPNVKALLENKSIQKIFHFARFDVEILYRTFGTLCQSVYCTKIASRLCRTYTDRHSLRELCRELLNVDLSKSEQTSDWGATFLSDAQKTYAACDVLFLHQLKEKLNERLAREERKSLFESVCEFLPQRALLDNRGFNEDIFSHS